jgi:hypothetical protein
MLKSLSSKSCLLTSKALRGASHGVGVGVVGVGVSVVHLSRHFEWFDLLNYTLLYFIKKHFTFFYFHIFLRSHFFEYFFIDKL